MKSGAASHGGTRAADHNRLSFIPHGKYAYGLLALAIMLTIALLKLKPVPSSPSR